MPEDNNFDKEIEGYEKEVEEVGDSIKELKQKSVVMEWITKIVKTLIDLLKVWAVKKIK